MNTTEILNTETAHRFSKGFLITKPVKRLLAASFGTLLVICATLSANAHGLVYSVNIVGCVPDMTTYLLTAPLTTAQRQALHAQNFNQLPPSARAAYLHAVAYAVSFAVASDGKVPTAAMLAEHLKTVSSSYDVPAIPPQYSAPAAAHLAIVNTALQELNVGISGVVANNSSLQQAIYAGAVSGFFLDNPASTGN